jgi:D-alanyl-D-alanine carboxypeptidase (penicillin-binding protein 5/6)
LALTGAPPANAATAAGPPRAWVLLDAGTGRIVSSSNARVALPPASLSKVLTALVVVRTLGPNTTVPVSARAAAAPPMKIGMKKGQVWRTEDALRALLMVSANDAAVALAERAGGTLTGFQRAMAFTATRLGVADSPVLRDPAGLDGPDGVGGGNRVSARDLAIITRAALAEPRIAAIVATQRYRFTGPDGKRHQLVNHNKLLGSYRGLVGVKTGFTSRAGGCLVTAARRKGRTMIAVVLGSQDIYGPSRRLLDQGFATAPSKESLIGRLAMPGPSLQALS